MSSFDDYALPAFVTVASLAQQGRFAKRVGLSRMKFKIQPPETTGDPEFVRTFRAQQNCVEFYPLALGSLWLSSTYFNPVTASLAGTVYIIGRQLYFDGYVQHAEKRWSGFKLSKNALLAMLVMSGMGVTTALLRRYTDVDLAVIANEFFSKIINRQ